MSTGGWSALALALLASAPACGRHDDLGTARRLTLHPTSATPDKPAALRVSPLDEPGAWEFAAPGIQLPARDAAADERVVVLGAGRAEQLVECVRRGPVALVDAGFVRLVASFEGRGTLAVDLLRGGERLATLGPMELGPSGALRSYDVPFDDRSRQIASVDALRLRCEGGARRLGIASLEVVPAFDLAVLPDASAAPEPVQVGTTWRPAVGAVAGQELTTVVRPRPGERLHFAVGLPPGLSRPGQSRPDMLRVVLEHEGRALDERLVPIDVTPQAERRWVDVEWGLGRFAGRESMLRFRVEPSEPGRVAACALTAPEIWVPGPIGPVVLLITSDTHRADHLGAARSGVRVDTPQLDALAARGVMFLDCSSPANVTGPAHQALFTGVHPRDLQPVLNGVPLDGLLPTLAERFHERGWATVAVVSAKHLGPRYSGLGRGFDRIDRPETTQRVATQSVPLLEGWVDRLGGRPVFAWLHVFDAHAPYDPPHAYDRRYYPADVDPWADDRGHPGPIAPRDMPGLRDMSYARAQYAAEVTALDAALAGLLERPEVIAGVTAFVADHGEGLGEHQVHFDHAELYPETLDVPLLLAWPGAPAGEQVRRPVTSLDLGRTLLDRAGLVDVPFPGRNLTQDGGGAEPRMAVSSGGLSAAIRDGRWFLVLHLQAHQTAHTVRAYDRHEVELYDVEQDPGCDRDRVAAEPDTARRLRARLVEWLQAAREPADRDAAEPDGETAGLLAELGYTGGARVGSAAWWQPDHCARCRAFEEGAR